MSFACFPVGEAGRSNLGRRRALLESRCNLYQLGVAAPRLWPRNLVATARRFKIERGLAGEEDDLLGLRWKAQGMHLAGQIGIALLWLAAILTMITGWDYFRKALPYLKD